MEDGLYDPFQPDSPPAPSSFGFTPLGSTPLSSGSTPLSSRSTLVENIPHSQPISSQLTMLPDSEVEDGLYDTFQPDSPPAPSSSGSTPLSGSMLVENTPHSLSQPIPSQLTMQPDTEGEPSTSLASSQPPLSNTDTTSYVCRVLAQLKALSSGKSWSWTLLYWVKSWLSLTSTRQQLWVPLTSMFPPHDRGPGQPPSCMLGRRSVERHFSPCTA